MTNEENGGTTLPVVIRPESSLISEINERHTISGKLSYVLKNTVTGKLVISFWIMFFIQFVVFPILIGPIYTGGMGSEISELWKMLFTLSVGSELYFWTYFTSIFSHGGLAHILVNSIVLLSFGLFIEEDYGAKQFFGLFFVGGIVASIGQLFIANLAIMGVPVLELWAQGELLFLGASGGIASVIGAMTMKDPKREVYLFFFPFLNVSLFIAVVGFVVISTVILLTLGVGAFRMAHTAHIVGALFGIWHGKKTYGVWKVKVFLRDLVYEYFY